MKNRILLFLLALVAVLPVQGAKLKTEVDSANYALGYYYGAASEHLPFGFEKKFDKNLFIEGIKASFSGKSNIFSDFDEANMFLSEFFDKLSRAEAESNRLESEEFLAKNRLRPDIFETESGLQYEIHREGEGDQRPGESDQVIVHYRGTMIDGTEFDSSYERGEPSEFSLRQVIPGFAEGLQLMTAGAHYTFYLPGELGYGERTTGQIPPNSVLIFDVELLEVEPSDDEVEGLTVSDLNSEERLRLHVGDYQLLLLDETGIEIPEYDTSYDTRVDYQGLVFAQSGDAFHVFDLTGDQLLQYPQSHTRSLIFLVPNSGTYPFFVLSENQFYNYATDESEWGDTDVFVVTAGHDIFPVGTIRIVPPFTEYSRYIPKEADWKVYNDGHNTVRFYIEDQAFYLDPAGSRTLISGEEAYYELSDGGTLELKGTILSSKGYRQHLLWEELQEKYNGNIRRIAFGDVNGDGEEDVVFQLEDSNELYIVLCKNYKETATHRFEIEGPEFRFSAWGDDFRSFSAKKSVIDGKITLYVPIEDYEDIEMRRYEFRKGELILIDSGRMYIYGDIG